ncbi:hypothetical protein V1525DRAFT_403107 [Lipomyces kononenkoae]|uniref:Uncharacterized protein n=1 Tax=Lipomyces kononenkoae TaxID=34357 RepID=A0ACC3T2D0_LIPKO
MSALADTFFDSSDVSQWDPSLVVRANCISCPSALPSCPTCAPDEQCQLSLQTCSSCPSTSCVKKYSSGSSSTSQPSASGSGTSGSTSVPVGGIVGGAVGGFVFVCAIFAILFFFFRRRRMRLLATAARGGGGGTGTTPEESVDDDEKMSQVADVHTRPRSIAASERYQYGDMPGARQSTHTVASSVITRASNVIPIAYIPGVINRSNPNSPSDVPPIPEIPLEHVGQQQQQHVQLVQPYYDGLNGAPPPHTPMDSPNDMTRGMSIYSAATYDSQEDQSIRDSVGLRDSVVTSAYRSTVVVAPAMMTAIRAKPNLIEPKQ